MHYKIKEVANISGVSVRMLHYYDKIGLLKPKSVSQAGYRLYTTDDINKLSQILFYRELDFSLEEIKKIIGTSNSSKLEVLKMQQQILSKKRDKIDAIIRAITKSIISLEQGEDTRDPNILTSLDLAEMIRNKEQYKTDLMTHLFVSDEDCGAKTSQYSNEDWTVVMFKMERILNEIADKSDKGPADAEIQDLISKYKEFINDNLTTCNSNTLKTLGVLYIDNPVYRSYMERYGDSFPEFLKSAIDIYKND